MPVMEKEHSAQSAAETLQQGGHAACEIAASELMLQHSGTVTHSHETLGSSFVGKEVFNTQKII